MRARAIIAAILGIIGGMIGVAVGATSVRAQKVDLLLVLAADVSRSIDEDEFALQRRGYAAAMTDPRVLQAIAGGPQHGIALSFIEWAGPEEQNVVVDWTTVRDEEAGSVVAAKMLSTPRSFVGRTSISAAIDFAMARLSAAPQQSDRRIIDISGDGTNNSGRPVTEARDQAAAAGITVNGLAITNTRAGPGYAFHTNPPGGLPKYYEDNVIGGPAAFLLQIENFDSFSDALTRKLVAEIARTKDRSAVAVLR